MLAGPFLYVAMTHWPWLLFDWENPGFAGVAVAV